MSNLFQFTGLNSLPVDSISPQIIVSQKRTPGVNDWQNQQVGNFWLYTNPNTNVQSLWVLMSLFGNQALWVELTAGAGALITLTGNSGGAVSPLLGNINVVGDGTTINVVGNPGTHTLTISAIGSGMVSTLTGNSGGAVSPTAGNINVVGTGVITVVGNPGTSTLTVTPSGAIASSFITNPATGTATPVLGVLTFAGAGGITVSAAGSTVTITGGTTVAESFPTDSGTATPSANVLNVLGGTAGRDINTSGSGNTIHIDLNNTITLGDLSIVTTGNPSVTLTSGDLTISGTGVNAAGNLNLPLNDSSKRGVINSNSTRFIHCYPGTATTTTFIGLGSGNFTHTSNGGITGVGASTLVALTTAIDTTCIGQSAGVAITTGSHNTIIGKDGAVMLTTGQSNTLIGDSVCTAAGGGAGLVTGSFNIAIGRQAGTAWIAAESNNLSIGPSAGVVGESNVVRINNGNSAYTKVFIEGIRGVTTVNNDAVAVLIDSAGQLGTVSSSIKFKENIKDMSDVSSALMNLRPVVFNYIGRSAKEVRTGLIAEEVLKVMPDLVADDSHGQPFSVKYHELPALLLNEIQKLNKRIVDLEAKLSKL